VLQAFKALLVLLALQDLSVLPVLLVSELPAPPVFKVLKAQPVLRGLLVLPVQLAFKVQQVFKALRVLRALPALPVDRIFLPRVFSLPAL